MKPVRAAMLAGIVLVSAASVPARSAAAEPSFNAKGTEGMAPASPAPKQTNRLINATSPYLLQHARNPVDWYEWGEEAFQKARKEEKPVFVSIFMANGILASLCNFTMVAVGQLS